MADISPKKGREAEARCTRDDKDNDQVALQLPGSMELDGKDAELEPLSAERKKTLKIACPLILGAIYDLGSRTGVRCVRVDRGGLDRRVPTAVRLPTALRPSPPPPPQAMSSASAWPTMGWPQTWSST